MNKKSLIDTNILIYATDEDSFYYNSSSNFLQSLTKTEQLYLSTQNLTEFYAIVTNSKRVHHPLTQDKAVKIIIQFLKSGIFQMITPKQKAMEIIIKLLIKYKIKSTEIHDINLAAVMIENNIQTIYTADTTVFERVGLNAINPLK